MKTYLGLEGKLDNQPCTNVFLPNINSLPRKTLAPQKAEKKRRAKVPVKRRFKVRVITQPMSTNPTLPMNPIPPAEPTPTVATSTVTTPNASGKISSHIHSSNCIQLSPRQAQGNPLSHNKIPRRRRSLHFQL